MNFEFKSKYNYIIAQKLTESQGFQQGVFLQAI